MKAILDGIDVYLYVKELTEFGLEREELDAILMQLFEHDKVKFEN